jgi:hypothetical protein
MGEGIYTFENLLAFMPEGWEAKARECGKLFRDAGLLVEKPAWLLGKNVCLVDGSEEFTLGSRKTCSMPHYCLDLFTPGMREFHLADRGTGPTGACRGYGVWENGERVCAAAAGQGVQGL